MNENAFAIQNDVIQSLKREGKFDKYRNQIKDKLINNEGYVKRTIVSFLNLNKFFETPIPILQNSTLSHFCFSVFYYFAVDIILGRKCLISLGLYILLNNDILFRIKLGKEPMKWFRSEWRRCRADWRTSPWRMNCAAPSRLSSIMKRKQIENRLATFLRKLQSQLHCRILKIFSLRLHCSCSYCFSASLKGMQKKTELQKRPAAGC